jgi:hypothetical protein
VDRIIDMSNPTWLKPLILKQVVTAIIDTEIGTRDRAHVNLKQCGPGFEGNGGWELGK